MFLLWIRDIIHISIEQVYDISTYIQTGLAKRVYVLYPHIIHSTYGYLVHRFHVGSTVACSFQREPCQGEK
jgi:hypothetical protein